MGDESVPVLSLEMRTVEPPHPVFLFILSYIAFLELSVRQDKLGNNDPHILGPFYLDLTLLFSYTDHTSNRILIIDPMRVIINRALMKKLLFPSGQDVNPKALSSVSTPKWAVLTSH